MKGLRYSPLHVTEFCGEMQGKFKDEDNNFGASLALDLRISWLRVKTLCK